MKRWMIGTLLLSGLMYGGAARAITVDEVVQLSRSGAGDNIILAQIQADSTVFHLTVQEILDLKDAGVSDQVITFMINTGKNLGVVQETVPYVEEEAVVEEPVAEPTSSGYVDMGVSPGGISFSVGFGFGYYYPSWPGYSWSWYCDPFYWSCWPSYYAYWAPWPASYYCYAPNYYCRYGYAYGGYCGGYYGGYWGGYYPSYAYYDGRNIGNRGPSGGYDRTYKDPSPGTGTVARSAARQQQRIGTPRDGVHDYARLDARPESRSRATAGTPSRRGNAPEVQVIRSRPTKERVSQTRPTSRSRSSVSKPRSGGGSSTKVQRQTPSTSRPSARSAAKAKPAPSKGKVKPAPSKSKSKAAPSRSNMRSAPKTRSAPARGSVRSAPRSGSASRGGGARTSRSGGGSRSSGGGRRH
jgi:hypothetical protein